jgi:hypothetical protein
VVPSATIRTRDLPLTRRQLFQLSYEGDEEDPLRLYPHASVPSDVVPRCTGPGQGRAHPAPHTPVGDDGVHGHSRSGAVTRLMCVPPFGKKIDRPVPTIVLRQLVKEQTTARRRSTRAEKQKGPDPFGIRACREQSVKGTPLGAALSRWIHVIASLKPLMTQGPCGDTGARKRDSTRHGSVRFGVAQRCHDESFRSNSRPFRAKERTVKTLNPRRQALRQWGCPALHRTHTPP